MTARRGYPAVDRFRVAAALLVVCIHTAPLASFFRSGGFCAENAGAAGRAVLFHGNRIFFCWGACAPRPAVPDAFARRAPLFEKDGRSVCGLHRAVPARDAVCGEFPCGKRAGGACAGRCAGRHVLSPVVPARRAAGSAGGVRAAALPAPRRGGGRVRRAVSGGAFGRQLVWPCKTAARAERGL